MQTDFTSRFHLVAFVSYAIASLSSLVLELIRRLREFRTTRGHVGVNCSSLQAFRFFPLDCQYVCV
jgi:hypothetical protein